MIGKQGVLKQYYSVGKGNWDLAENQFSCIFILSVFVFVFVFVFVYLQETRGGASGTR